MRILKAVHGYDVRRTHIFQLCNSYCLSSASLAKSRRLGLVAIIPDAIVIATTHADEKDIKKITALCDEVEKLLKTHKNHTQKDIEFHTAIALSSKNVVVPRLVPMINSSIPLFVETTGGTLHEETIETHREITNAIASHDPLRAQDAMYLHLVYNRKRIQLSQK